MGLEQRSFSEAWTRKMFLGELQGNAFATNLVLRAGGAGFGEGVAAGALLGYIMFWVVFEELHLMNLAVRPEVRRHGIGLALVRHALTAAAAQGGPEALLEGRAADTAAPAFFRKLRVVPKSPRQS